MWRETEASAQSDDVFLIRPGTDAALALAMMHVIVGERLYDPDFVGSHTVGFDELQELARQCGEVPLDDESQEKRDWLEKLRRVETIPLPPLMVGIAQPEQLRDLVQAMTQKRRDLRPRTAQAALEWMREVEARQHTS